MEPRTEPDPKNFIFSGPEPEPKPLNKIRWNRNRNRMEPKIFTDSQLFSASKNTITDKRTSLAAERVNKLLFLQKNLRLLKEIAEQSGKELSETQTKRNQTTPAPSSSHDNHNQFTTTTIAKKFKLNEENDGFFSNSDSEHDDVFFCEY